MKTAVTRLFVFAVSALFLGGLCACRDDLDLETAQAVLVKDNRRKHPSIYQPNRDQKRSPEVFEVKFRTAKIGNFVIEVHRSWAPRAADRFYNLVKAGYWKGTSFIRVIRGHVVQWGIHGNPIVTKSWQEQAFDPDPVVKTNKAGYVAFAPEVGTGKPATQILVNLSDHPDYDKVGYAPFGRITQGFDVLSRSFGRYGEFKEIGNKDGISVKMVIKRGEPYLERNFPLLTKIRSAQLTVK